MLQKKVNQLTQIRNTEQERKRWEILQLKEEKDWELMLIEKEKDPDISFELEKMKLAYEERITVEKLNIEKIRIDLDMQQETNNKNELLRKYKTSQTCVCKVLWNNVQIVGILGF